MKNPVAVRIQRRPDGHYLVKGRRTAAVCDTFDQAWTISVLYFAGRLQ